MAKSQTKNETEVIDDSNLSDTIKQLIVSQSRVSEKLTVVADRLALNADVKSQMQKAERKRREYSLRHDVRLWETERALLEGTQFFRVSISDEPMMTRYVGTTEAPTLDTAATMAQRKFMRYFGISKLEEPDRLTAEHVDALPSFDDEKAWQKIQYKHIRDGRKAEEELAKLAL